MRLGDRQARGQGLVEFALVLPLVILLILAIVDFGRGIFIYSVVQNAAAEGARYAIVHGSLAQSLDGRCASGPGATGSCSDPTGANIAAAAKTFAIGLDPAAITTGSCWGFACTVSNDCATSVNAANAANTPMTPVTVATCYEFKPIASNILPIPAIGIRGTVTLTINH